MTDNQNTPQNAPSAIKEYARLMRIDRPVGTLLLLWPTLAALWMASEGVPTLTLIAIFALGTFLMRAAGCVINDYADRNVDGRVERTQGRPLAIGTITTKHALTLFGVLVACSGLLLLFLNRQTQLLAFGGLAVAILYPFMKRWTQMPQAVLGVAFSWGILMAWTATGAALSSNAWLLFIGSLLWIVAYDTMYAMVDREDDSLIGVKSTAILFGELDLLMIGVLQSGALLCWALLGLRLGYQMVYFIGIIVAAGLSLYQQYLMRNRDRAGCFAAFGNNIWVGFALFVGTVAQLAMGSLGS